MDNRVGVVLTISLLVTVVVMAAGFSYLQSEINSLKRPNATPTLTSTYQLHTPTPAPTNTRTIQPTQSPSHSSTIYTWYLKPDYMGNETWLKEMFGFTGVKYDSAKSWSDNYIAFISSIWEVPQFVKDEHITGLVGAAFIEHLPVTVSYNDATGYTKATYKYEDGLYYVIESSLPTLAVNGDWVKEFV